MDSQVPSKQDKCYHKFSQLYIQVQCDLSEADEVRAKRSAVIVIFLGMVISIWYYLCVRY